MSSDEGRTTGLGLHAKRLGCMGRVARMTAGRCKYNKGNQPQQQVTTHLASTINVSLHPPAQSDSL